MTETDAQREIKRALARLGFYVSDLSQGYRPGGKRHGTTRITKGVPDLYFQHPVHGVGWLEVKGEDTPVTDDQRKWHAQERHSGGKVAVVRSASDAMWALKAWGVPVELSGEPSEEIAEQFPELVTRTT